MDPIRFDEVAIPGLLLLRPRVSTDDRGCFAKTFVARQFEALGLATEYPEEFWTRSRRGVVRGMHFQLPPSDHDKVVFCVHGTVFDVIVDLRVGSPTFYEALTFTLDSNEGTGLYVPTGCAHGFAALSDEAVLAYKVTRGHDPERDRGVLWSSVSVAWPFADPIVSERDAGLPTLQDFDSPFAWQGEGCSV